MPDQTLKRLRIAGWKSIRDASLELGPINVLIGANGAGKSNLLSFFRLLSHFFAYDLPHGDRLPDSDHLRNYIRRCGGANAVLHLGAKRTPAVDVELLLQAGTKQTRYTTILAAAADDTLVFAEERIESLHDQDVQPQEVHVSEADYSSTALALFAQKGKPAAAVMHGLLSRCRVFHFHDTSENGPMRRSCYVKANRQLYSDGGNVAAMLYLYRETRPVVYRRILAAIRQIAPFIGDLIVEPDRLNAKNIILRWRQPGGDYELGPHQLSDGTLRMIALVTLLAQPEEDLPALVALDEPELGLHPAAIRLVGSLVRKASHYCQIVLATQSTTFVDCFEPGDVVVVKGGEAGTTFERLDSAALGEWLDSYSVSELWEKNVLGGGPF
jgi:predicted ATPase